MLSAVVLAAGESKRMGQPKQLLPFRGGTILARVVDNLLGSAVDEVIVVLGHRAEEIKRTIASRPVRTVINPDYKLGMSSAIATGLNELDRQSQVVMLVLGDQPLVSSRTINRLIEEFYAHNKGIAVPTYRGRRGHPVIFSIKYKPELLALKGDVGAREIINRHAKDVLEVTVGSRGVITDIDTSDDYRA